MSNVFCKRCGKKKDLDRDKGDLCGDCIDFLCDDSNDVDRR